MFAKRLREKFAFFLSHLQERLTKDARGETFFHEPSIFGKWHMPLPNSV
jgi:hypothetical protein